MRDRLREVTSAVSHHCSESRGARERGDWDSNPGIPDCESHARKDDLSELNQVGKRDQTFITLCQQILDADHPEKGRMTMGKGTQSKANP